MFWNIFIQLLAIIALVIWASSYHFKSRRGILLFQLLSFIFWIAHFILLGAITGAVLSTIAAIRLALFSFKTETNWISKPIVMYFFVVLLVVSTAVTYSAYWSIFALIGGIFAIIASWQNDKNRIRILFIPSHLFWILYDVLAGSYGGAISEAVLGVSALWSFLKKEK
jgi:hypothetical protein